MAIGEISTSVSRFEAQENIKITSYMCMLCRATYQVRFPRRCCDGIDRSAMTFGDIHKAALPGAVYDTALPQSWYDEVFKVAGQNPSGHFVWLYDDPARGFTSLFGEPVALSNVAQWLVNSGQVKARILPAASADS